MAILNLVFSGTAIDGDGNEVQIPSNEVMRIQGPCLQVSINVAQPMAEQVLLSGGQLPIPITGIALVDTGAAVTCIDDAAAQALGLPAIDVVQMASASHLSTAANVYPVRIQVLGTEINFELARAMGANLAGQGLIALIGRDLLQLSTLHFNGPAGSISLAL